MAASLNLSLKKQTCALTAQTASWTLSKMSSLSSLNRAAQAGAATVLRREREASRSLSLATTQQWTSVR